MKDMLIVKFGGSSIASPDLRKWVQSIERSTRPLVVVPGGGPFANTVRQFQTRIGYDADAAHRMAILAIEQFGHALVSLGEKLVAASTIEAIEAAQGRGQVPVWMPAKLVLRAEEIEHTWSVTSDSLAAWLASRIPGSTLCLIKQIDLPAGSSIQAISAAGVVDSAFAALLHPSTRVFVAGPSDLPLAARRLAEGVAPGREIGSEARGASFVEAAQ
ncbi:amino acid kinase family protein [Aureimonas pseudogalii]|uniref:Dihydroneopterin aldolase n=1 Tax=Aureimonas pseudogalii TaxID=1744844 RepID=A0A7W6EEW3_9HYPH|nr:amino acid kinase [Aureimonas pseudogalii]MBB3997380.1 dihydroneopterin aldolase [Aureimonas pseudogalii]